MEPEYYSTGRRLPSRPIDAGWLTQREGDRTAPYSSEDVERIRDTLDVRLHSWQRNVLLDETVRAVVSALTSILGDPGSAVLFDNTDRSLVREAAQLTEQLEARPPPGQRQLEAASERIRQVLREWVTHQRG